MECESQITSLVEATGVTDSKIVTLTQMKELKKFLKFQ